MWFLDQCQREDEISHSLSRGANETSFAIGLCHHSTKSSSPSGTLSILLGEKQCVLCLLQSYVCQLVGQYL